ncbi:hypothetical protein B8V60_01125 [Streptococcus agalactiae]|nr:hypothetical protein A6J82_00760 [Streptococcus agalactiae]KAA9118188.1 hypothetical protein F5284_09980 [Streptococcus agalactiae]KAF1101962.1 hypothetical protein B8U81_07850 [Streptococcus agalactiae]KAF1107813.1 hypothetical protein B8V09_03905 [Streptococcus agalactiae]KAF1125820.1 hypothetical protein B8U92_09345 [Streptococcus agalactiae]
MINNIFDNFFHYNKKKVGGQLLNWLIRKFVILSLIT